MFVEVENILDADSKEKIIINIYKIVSILKSEEDIIITPNKTILRESTYHLVYDNSSYFIDEASFIKIKRIMRENNLIFN